MFNDFCGWKCKICARGAKDLVTSMMSVDAHAVAADRDIAIAEGTARKVVAGSVIGIGRRQGRHRSRRTIHTEDVEQTRIGINFTRADGLDITIADSKVTATGSSQGAADIVGRE